MILIKIAILIANIPYNIVSKYYSLKSWIIQKYLLIKYKKLIKRYSEPKHPFIWVSRNQKIETKEQKIKQYVNLEHIANKLAWRSWINSFYFVENYSNNCYGRVFKWYLEYTSIRKFLCTKCEKEFKHFTD